jgi:hypothetical protein
MNGPHRYFQRNRGDEFEPPHVIVAASISHQAILVKASHSWKLITKDQVMREKYERIKIRSGGKRAIVAIARTRLLRMRRMLLDGRAYALPLAA